MRERLASRETTWKLVTVIPTVAALVWLSATAVQSAAPPHATARSETAPAPLILVREDDRWSVVAEVSADGGFASLPIPFLSRSERVVRATRSAHGTGIALYAGEGMTLEIDAVEARVVAHPADSQILLVDGAPSLIGPPALAESIVRPAHDDDVLPELARQDVNTIQGGEIAVTPPRDTAGLSLVVIAGESSEPTSIRFGESERRLALPESSRAALASTLTSAKPFRIGLLEGEIDQLFFATVAALDDARAEPLALRAVHGRRATARERSARHGEGRAWPRIEVATTGGTTPDLDTLRSADGRAVSVEPGGWLELWFDSPPGATAGHTQTLLLSVKLRTPPIAAKAVRNATYETPRGAESTAALFRERTREAGLRLVHMEGPDEQLDIRPTMGPGLALGDIDGDGWVDVFLVQGGGREGSRMPSSRMYRNRGDGTFADVSRASGLALLGRGMGALFFDVEGDGDLDLFVANYGENTLCLNDGHGRFVRAPASACVVSDRWHAAVSAADYDRDGDLDLYVTSYLKYDLAQIPPSDELDRYRREDPVAMLPFAFPGETKLFLRNDTPAGALAPDALRFTDVAAPLGLDDPQGRGMQAVFWDFDRDGDQDLYLANDVSPNRLWRNEGDGTFKDIGFTTGMDDPRGSMGLAAADVDGDGDEDMLVTNWELEANALYVNNLVSHDSAKHRVATFRDAAVRAGLAQLSVGVTKWGVELLDADLDGDLDLFYANGYTSPDYESTGICVGQPCHYFENVGSGRFKAAFDRAGPDVAMPLASRAASACDFDQDGDMDLFVTANNGRARLLENTQTSGRAWLGVRLAGRGRNPYAIGAEVTLHAGERIWRRSLRAGTSYLAGNAPELHFGLGDVSRIDECVVRWPSGQESRHDIQSLRTFVTLSEPELSTKPR